MLSLHVSLRGSFALVGLVYLVCVHTACTCVNVEADVEMSAAVSRVKSELKPLSSQVSVESTSDRKRYLEYYRIGPVHEHNLGTFSSGDLELAGQFFHPSESRPSKGSVIVVHGYLDHAGTTANLVNHLVGEGYHVAVHDHPGHGLSAGRRASVQDFEMYRVAFSDFFDIASSRLPAPYHVVAHSMGSTVVIDYLNKKESSPFQGMVFLTPLMKDRKPRSLHMFAAVISPFIDHLGRVREKNTTNLEYEEFSVKDPLQPGCVSTRWSVALNRWRRESKDFEPRSESPLIVYGASDAVVDNQASREWFQRVFPRHRSVVIEQANHQIHNEIEPIREWVLKLISRELE